METARNRERPGNRNLKRTAGPGRPKGSKDKIPKTFKASIARTYEEIGRKHPKLYMQALVRGLRARPPHSFQYLRLAAEYLDGAPLREVSLYGRLDVDATASVVSLMGRLARIAAGERAAEIPELPPAGGTSGP